MSSRATVEGPGGAGGAVVVPPDPPRSLDSARDDKGKRIQSLDSFRGATVAAMLLVNNPGTWSAIWPPLRHAAWHGCTPTDLVFPFFLFIVGITTELSRKEPLRILRRGALIIFLGLLVNAFPYFELGTLRWTGVLQRIGIVYIVAALIAWRASRKVIIAIVAVILIGYWFVLWHGPLEPPIATVAAHVDRMLIPAEHLWKQSKTWDPEGPLSTIPAVATALLGVLAAPWVKEKKIKLLTIAGVIGIVVGWAWGLVFPLNKSLWTSSYVLVTSGLAGLMLAGLHVLLDGRAPSDGRGGAAVRIAQPFVILGRNALLLFVVSGLLAKTLALIRVDNGQGASVALGRWIYLAWFVPLASPKNASLLFAFANLGLLFLLLLWLHRRRWYLKV